MHVEKVRRREIAHHSSRLQRRSAYTQELAQHYLCGVVGREVLGPLASGHNKHKERARCNACVSGHTFLLSSLWVAHVFVHGLQLRVADEQYVSVRANPPRCATRLPQRSACSASSLAGRAPEEQTKTIITYFFRPSEML